MDALTLKCNGEVQQNRESDSMSLRLNLSKRKLNHAVSFC